jgi:hypothetical protein
VDEACRDPPAVKKLVEALLEENDRLSGFLSDPPYKKAGETAAHLLAPGRQVSIEGGESPASPVATRPGIQLTVS